MKTRYSGKSFKDSSTMKKSKLSFREKRKIKREKKKNKGHLLSVVHGSWLKIPVAFRLLLAQGDYASGFGVVG